MKHKFSLIAAVIFFIGYSYVVTVGSIYLVTFGEATTFKTVVNFVLGFPLDWLHLINDHPWLSLVANVLCWTAVVYGVAFMFERLVSDMLTNPQKFYQQ